jgi:hypothetical protein
MENGLHYVSEPGIELFRACRLHIANNGIASLTSMSHKHGRLHYSLNSPTRAGIDPDPRNQAGIWAVEYPTAIPYRLWHDEESVICKVRMFGKVVKEWGGLQYRGELVRIVSITIKHHVQLSYLAGQGVTVYSLEPVSYMPQ